MRAVILIAFRLVCLSALLTMAIPTYTTGGGTSNQTIAPNLRQLARGISATFEADFFEDSPQNTIPAIPASYAASWAIVTPTGTQVANGLATPGSIPGRWVAVWSVPMDAALSTQESKWRIVWNLVSGTSRQLQQTIPFDVVELRTPNTLEELRTNSYIIYAGQAERLILRLPRRPDSMSVSIFEPTSLANMTPKTTPLASGSLAASTVLEVQEQNLFCYLFDTPAIVTAGEYQVMWNYRQTMTSPSDTVVQKLFVPPPIFWSLSPSLKTLVDKLQKKQGSIHAYTPSDMFEYFQRGIGILNGVPPFTEWDMLSLPYNSVTTRFLLEAAALWAMDAMHILAGELQFSFSGQRVTLDVDHTSLYDSISQKLLSRLTSSEQGSWPNAKQELMRSKSAAAVVGGRLMGRYSTNRPVLRVGSGIAGAPLSDPFTPLGLQPMEAYNALIAVTSSLGV